MDEAIALILLLLLLFVGSCIYSFVLSLKNRNAISKIQNEMNMLRKELITVKNHSQKQTAPKATEALLSTLNAPAPDMVHGSTSQTAHNSEQQISFEQDIA